MRRYISSTRSLASRARGLETLTSVVTPCSTFAGAAFGLGRSRSKSPPGVHVDEAGGHDHPARVEDLVGGEARRAHLREDVALDQGDRLRAGARPSPVHEARALHQQPPRHSGASTFRRRRARALLSTALWPAPGAGPRVRRPPSRRTADRSLPSRHASPRERVEVLGERDVVDERRELAVEERHLHLLGERRRASLAPRPGGCPGASAPGARGMPSRCPNAREEGRRGVLAEPGDPGDPVGRVAHERQEVRHATPGAMPLERRSSASSISRRRMRSTCTTRRPRMHCPRSLSGVRMRTWSTSSRQRAAAVARASSAS